MTKLPKRKKMVILNKKMKLFNKKNTRKKIKPK